MTPDELKLHLHRQRRRSKNPPKFYVDDVSWQHPIEILIHKRANDQYFVDIINDIMQQAMDRNIEFSAYYQAIGLPWAVVTDEWKGRNHLLFHCDNAFMHTDDFFNFVRTHSEMKILLISSQLFPENNQGLVNLRIIHWGSDYLLEKEEYQNIDAIEKSFVTDYHWISLSNHPRLHRWMAALYLKGLGLDTTGRLSISKQPITFGMVPMYNPNNGITITNWRVPCQHEWIVTQEQDNSYSSIFDLGFEQISDHDLNPPVREHIYDSADGNAANLHLRLRPLYTNTAVEIVNETIFNFEMGMHMTEKFINSVYGMNLPIVLGQPGIVKYCRALEFDMFDDVVDHSYDVITRPIDRLTAAIDRNRRLLEDRDFAMAAWHRCQPRLQANYELARHRLHDQVYTRVMSEVPAALDFLS